MLNRQCQEHMALEGKVKLHFLIAMSVSPGHKIGPKQGHGKNSGQHVNSTWSTLSISSAASETDTDHSAGSYSYPHCLLYDC